jgi:PST family polysaccharide transporter
MASLGEALAASTLSVAFAALGFGPYSLVLPSPIAAAGRIGALWLIAKPRIRAFRRGRRWRMLLPSASALLGGRLLGTMMSQADYMTLGFVAGEVEVGIYYFAFKLAIQPLRILAGSLSAVLFPTLVQYRDDPARQLDAAIVASQMLSIVVMPACFLQAALAAPALHLFFASKWDAAAPLLQLLSIGFAFDASSWAAGALLAARGEFRRWFVYTAIETPTFVLLIAAGALSRGAFGVAAAVASFYVVVQPIFCYLVFRRMGAVGWREIAWVYGPPVAFGAATAAAPTLLLRGLGSPGWLQLCLVPVIAASLYVPLIRACCPKPYRLLRDRVLAFRTRKAVA